MPFLVDKNHKKAKRFPNTLKESQKNCSIFATYATQIILHKIKTCTVFDLIQLCYYYFYFSMIKNVNKKLKIKHKKVFHCNCLFMMLHKTVAIDRAA